MIKTIPDLNKIRFTKIHRKRRIRTVDKGNKGKSLVSYSLGLKSKTASIIKPNQLEAFKKSINRNLKTKDKKNKKNFKIIKSVKTNVVRKKKKKEKIFFLRYNLCLGLTKKPLQVRMGKGKGAPVEWVYPAAKNRILMEFNILNFKKRFNKIKRILKKSSKKLKVKSKVLVNYKRLANPLKINKFNKLSYNKVFKKIKCVKEL